MRQMKKIILTTVCIIVALSISVTALAAYYGGAKEQSGSYISRTVNRVNFTLDNINQTFDYDENGYVAEIKFTAEKTEADFFACLNSFSLNGMNYEKAEIVPLESDNSTNQIFDGAVLGVSGGKPQSSAWLIRIFFNGDSGDSFTPVLSIEYTSGVKKNMADTHVFETELKLTVE